MLNKPNDAVAFARGTYEYSNRSGTATVHVPRDVMASEIASALACVLSKEVVPGGSEQRSQVSEAA